jgi:3',5'-cyclic AMP phosphodiesterase CpdA
MTDRKFTERLTMSDDNDLEAFLHIVHVSDIHCKTATPPEQIKCDAWVLKKLQLLAKGPPPCDVWAVNLKKLWDEGLSGHDPRAHLRMRGFLRWFARSEFGKVDTWLVATGDLTTLGDSPSLKTAMGWLHEYKTILNAKEFLIFHGNHDAWPGKFPVCATDADIDQHQSALRSLLPAPWPQTGISMPIPYTDSKLYLYAVNSIIADRFWNLFAHGRVSAEPAGSKAATDQLVALGKWASQKFHQDQNVRDFRILAVHHPIHYPPPRPRWSMSLLNDAKVAKALNRFNRKFKRGKLAHLVLSGHTHEPYPARGALPVHTTGWSYAPLADGQVQLVTGSLAQQASQQDRKRLAAHGFFPQQFQILTFFASPSSARKNQLLIERRLVGRRNGTGPYTILPPISSQVESMLIEY